MIKDTTACAVTFICPKWLNDLVDEKYKNYNERLKSLGSVYKLSKSAYIVEALKAFVKSNQEINFKED